MTCGLSKANNAWMLNQKSKGERGKGHEPTDTHLFWVPLDCVPGKNRFAFLGTWLGSNAELVTEMR